jgi:hypothetical protein
LLFGIGATCAFDFIPIFLGFGWATDIFFAFLYLPLIILLARADKRVLGYSTVLAACGTTGAVAHVSYSLMLALVTAVVRSGDLRRLLSVFGRHTWWRLLLTMSVVVMLTVLGSGFNHSAPELVGQLKAGLSLWGYLVLLPLAVGLTIDDAGDGVRLVAMLSVVSVSALTSFYVFGDVGFGVSRSTLLVAPEFSIGSAAGEVTRHIGQIHLNFNRTQVGTVLASLGATLWVLVLIVRSHRMPFLLGFVACVYLFSQTASIGSSAACIAGIVVASAAYMRTGRPGKKSTRLFAVAAVLTLSAVLVFSQTENIFMNRTAAKVVEFDEVGIDRSDVWMDGLRAIAQAPFGEGFSWRTGHSDWVVFTLGYGWLAGMFLILGVARLLGFLWREVSSVGTNGLQDAQLLLLGLAPLVSYALNAVLDMPSANFGYFQTIWCLILTPTAVAAVLIGSRWRAMAALTRRKQVSVARASQRISVSK